MNKPAMPNNMIDVIYKRRYVRSYKSQKLDPATINTLLAAAVRAPTALHEEPWAFVVLQDMSLMKSLSDRTKGLFIDEMRHAHTDRGGHTLDIFQHPDFNIFYNAGTLIIICGKSVGPFVAADCWLAAENLMLAACSMGLGTCVIGSAVSGLNSPEIKAELGIPSDISVIVPIIVGVPESEAPITPRKAPWVIAWK